MGKSWLLAFWNFFKQQESLKKKIETFFTQIVRNYFKNISNGHISGMMVYNTEYQTFEIVEKNEIPCGEPPKKPTVNMRVGFQLSKNRLNTRRTPNALFARE